MTSPFFQIFDDEFLDVLGANATIRMIAQNETFAFAHEAPIWHPATDQVSTGVFDSLDLRLEDEDAMFGKLIRTLHRFSLLRMMGERSG